VQLREKIDAAEGVRKADLVLTGGRLVNVATGEVYPADVAVVGDMIAAVGDVTPNTGPATTVIDVTGRYLVPGLIDGHLHIECSKLSVTMFADAVVRCGTTSVVSGLDQTYAVAGLEGVRDALSEAEASQMKIFWAAPYKVPYTIPESNVGFRLGPEVHEIAQKWDDCFGVWETVTEFITNRDAEVLEVIEMAGRNRLPVFGCAPMASAATIGVLLPTGREARAIPRVRFSWSGVTITLFGATVALVFGAVVAHLPWGAPLAILGVGGLILGLSALALYRVLDPLLRQEEIPSAERRALIEEELRARLQIAAETAE